MIVHWSFYKSMKQSRAVGTKIMAQISFYLVLKMHQPSWTFGYARCHGCFMTLWPCLHPVASIFLCYVTSIPFLAPATVLNNTNIYLTNAVPSNLFCRKTVAARWRGFWVRIPPEPWMSCLFWALCVVRSRSLRRADHLCRGVLPNVVCLSVIVKPR